MSQTVVVITEDALLPTDVEHIRAVAGDDVIYRLIVPTELDRSVVTAFLDNLALLDLKEAWEDLTGQNTLPPDVARSDAARELQESVDALTAAGCAVTGAGIADDVIAALRDEIAETDDLQQVVVVTRRHPVEDAFHRGWADRAQEELGLPVLHLYRGTSAIGG